MTDTLPGGWVRGDQIKSDTLASFIETAYGEMTIVSSINSYLSHGTYTATDKVTIVSITIASNERRKRYKFLTTPVVVA